jgi:hypothetical protein
VGGHGAVLRDSSLQPGLEVVGHGAADGGGDLRDTKLQLFGLFVHGVVQVMGGTWFASMKWCSWPLPDLKMTILDMMKTGKNGRRMVHIMFMNQGAFKMMKRAKLPVYLLGRKCMNK